MRGREESAGGAIATEQTVVYCVIPRDLAPKLHETLRRHFRDVPAIRVVVERRGLERRATTDRRGESADLPSRAPGSDRRRVLGAGGRRVGERRAPLVPTEAISLPRKAQPHNDRLVFLERLEPSDIALEDLDSARLIVGFQAGDRDAVATLYRRYFDRVYGYHRMLLKRPADAEDATQQTFVAVVEGLGRYELRGRPFRSWLFTVAHNAAVSRLRERGRTHTEDLQTIARRYDAEVESLDPAVLEWISDPDLAMFVERLPLPQRQVLALRFMLDLPTREVAEILGRSHADVRALQTRAIRFLRERLVAVGRVSRSGAREVDMRGCLRQAPVLRRRRYALIA